MLVGRLLKNLAGHNWFPVIVDVFVVIVSILVAFQIDRWADHIQTIVRGTAAPSSSPRHERWRM